MMNYARLEKKLIEHEGIRLNLYRDTVGKLTIGVGRNLDDRGISREEAYYLLNNDIKIAIETCNRIFQNFQKLDDTRQEVLINMAFQLGQIKLAKFKKMIKAIHSWNFNQAANEMLDSAWAKQVPRRAYELSLLMRTGENVSKQ